MKQNTMYSFICYFWFLVPVLSLVILYQRMITVGMSACFTSIPEMTYNGFQLLVHNNLVNHSNQIVIDMSLELILLRMMIAMQILFDVILILLSLWEWRKSTKKVFLWIRGFVSVGYVLTAFAIYRFVLICVGNHRTDHDLYRTYVVYHQYEIEVNILFSISVMILFIVSLLIHIHRGWNVRLRPVFHQLSRLPPDRSSKL